MKGEPVQRRPKECGQRELVKRFSLEGLSTQLKSEIYDLKDQLASCTTKTMNLKEEIHNSTWKTVMGMLGDDQCKRNLVYISIYEDKSSHT